ncbi:MAG: DUF1573 domain-containing protein [Planctomycetota bacterium]
MFLLDQTRVVGSIPRASRPALAALLTLALAVVLGGCQAEAPPPPNTTATRPTVQPGRPTQPQPGQPAPSVGEPPFRLEPQEWDFGAVGHLVDHSMEFTIENVSDRPLRLGTPKRSCDCLTITVSDKAIAPGEVRRGTMSVRFGRGSGRFNKYATFFLPDGSHPQTLRALARFHPTISTDSRELKLITFVGGRLSESQGLAVISPKNPRNGAPKVENVRIAKPKGARFDVQARNLDDGKVGLTVLARPGSSEGLISAEVRAEVDGLPLVIPVHGFQYEHLIWRPAQFLFSRIDDPATAEARVELYTPNDTTFEVTEAVFVEGRRKSAIQLDVTIEPREGGGVVLVARPRAPFPETKGSLSGVVRLRTTLPERPELEIRAIGFYNGKNGTR